MSFLLYLTACSGCGPNLPSDDNDDNNETQDEETADTEESAKETEETAPELPARCDALEVEPNDELAQAVAIPLHTWVCGYFGETEAPLGDIDWFTFTPERDDWLEVTVEAAYRGSSADAQFTLLDDENSITVLDGFLTTDPRMVAPGQPHAYTVGLGETSYANGDDYPWALRAAAVKAPVEWTMSETEPNDTYPYATMFLIDQTYFGTIERNGDFDWYHIVTPPKADSIILRMEAHTWGSPLDATMVIYQPDLTTIVRTDTTGEFSYDRDPYYEYKQDGSQEWYIVVRNSVTGGSAFHWYTLTISAVYDPDTGE